MDNNNNRWFQFILVWENCFGGETEMKLGNTHSEEKRHTNRKLHFLKNVLVEV